MNTVVHLLAVDGGVAYVVELQRTIERSRFSFTGQRSCQRREGRALEHRQRLGLNGDEAALVRHNATGGAYWNDLHSRPIHVIHLHAQQTRHRLSFPLPLLELYTRSQAVARIADRTASQHLWGVT